MCIAVYTLVHIHTSVNCLVCSSLQLSEQLGNLVFGSSDGKFLFFISTSASKQLGILSLKESHLCMMGCQSCVSACSLLSSNKGTNKQYRSQLLSHSLQYRYTCFLCRDILAFLASYIGRTSLWLLYGQNVYFLALLDV